MMNVNKRIFGTFQGRDVETFTLTNDNGMSVEIMTYGATVTSVKVPSRAGQLDDVVCGFNTLDEYFADEYKANSPYFGCAVGRYAARIKDGKFTVNGEQYTVATNDGPNHLHGGVVGFDKQVWSAEQITVENGAAVRFSLCQEMAMRAIPVN